MKPMLHLWIAGCLIVFPLLGCGEENMTPSSPEESSATSATEEEPLPVNLPRPESGDELGAAIYELASEYARGLEAHHRIDGPVLESRGFHDAMLVLPGNYCYKILGVGASGVEDLDLVLYDPNQIQIAQDLSEDARPVLGLTSPVCIRDTGQFRLQTRVVRGQGAFAVQVMRNASW